MAAKPPADDLDDAVERARARVRQEREETSAVSSMSHVWRDVQQSASRRVSDFSASVEAGKRLLAERKAASDAGSSHVSTASPDWLPELDGSTPARRAVVGFNHVFPLLGMLSAYSTYELMRAEGHGFNVDVLTRGSLRGVMRFLPFGLGTGLFYGVEYTLRPLQRYVSVKGGTGEDAYLHANVASKTAAGFVTGVAVSLPLHLMGYAGVRQLTGVAGLTLASTLGALMMPEYEQFESALW